MTTNLADTIKGLEDAIREIKSLGTALTVVATYIEPMLPTLDAALTHLRSQEETIRRCAEWEIADPDVILDLSCLADEEKAKATQRLEMSDSWRKHRRERAKRLIRLVSILRDI